MSLPLPVVATPDGIILTVRLTPRGGRDAFDGLEIDAAGRAMLRARVSAPPADGAANAALLALLAARLDVARRALRLESGATQRVKRIHVAGDSARLATFVGAIIEARR